MRTLTIECATEACSLALFDGDVLLAEQHQVLGRGHAEHLIPLIADLPGKGHAEVIRVSLGPGSFTGVRIGLAAARALAFAWGAQVLGYPTLALVAVGITEDEATDRQRLVCMTGGHGEWFVQPFDARGIATAPLISLAPKDAVGLYPQHLVIGSRAQDFVALRGSGQAYDALPIAAHTRRLPATVFSPSLTPLYGRGPDARLPG